MNYFCTIITSDFLPFSKVIYNSLKKFNANLNFYVLIVDTPQKKELHKDIKFIYLDEIKSSFRTEFKKIDKYEKDPTQTLRWAIKPLFLKFLLLKKGAKKVIYVDSDIYFFNDPNFLFDRLVSADVLVTPHWRSIIPEKDNLNFDLLFSQGVFNAGFFACNFNAINILDWWIDACSYKMVKANGFYDDQAYLNLMPIYFSSQVQFVEHKGCNVSSWNTIVCERTYNEKTDEVLINNQFPIIFIHFTNGTIWTILSGEDSLLKSYLRIYEIAIKEFLPNLQLGKTSKNFKKKYIKDFLKSHFEK